MTTLLQDIRYALRSLAKAPAFTGIAVLTIALGIGANTAIFSVVHAVLLRRLPYPEPDRLVVLREHHNQAGDMGVAWPTFLDWRERSRAFSGLAGFRRTEANVSGDREPEMLRVAQVSASLFPLLGVRAALGRTFVEADDRPGAPRTLILSDEVWRTRFASDPSIAGKTLRLDALPYTVVGVLPRSFGFFPERMDLYTPGRLERRRTGLVEPREPHGNARARPPGSRRDVRRGQERDGRDHAAARARAPGFQQRTAGDRDAPGGGPLRRRPGAALDAARGREPRPAHRVRQRRPPPARAGGLARQGVRHPRRPRGRPPPDRAAAPDGERAALDARRRSRPARGDVGHRAHPSPGPLGDSAPGRHPDRSGRAPLHAGRSPRHRYSLRTRPRGPGFAPRSPDDPARDGARRHQRPRPAAGARRPVRVRGRAGVRPRGGIGPAPAQPAAGPERAPRVQPERRPRPRREPSGRKVFARTAARVLLECRRRGAEPAGRPVGERRALPAVCRTMLGLRLSPLGSAGAAPGGAAELRFQRRRARLLPHDGDPAARRPLLHRRRLRGRGSRRPHQREHGAPLVAARESAGQADQAGLSPGRLSVPGDRRGRRRRAAEGLRLPRADRGLSPATPRTRNPA